MFKQKSQCLLLEECFNENVKQNCVWGKLAKTAGRNIGENNIFLLINLIHNLTVC